MSLKNKLLYVIKEFNGLNSGFITLIFCFLLWDLRTGSNNDKRFSIPLFLFILCGFYMIFYLKTLSKNYIHQSLILNFIIYFIGAIFAPYFLLNLCSFSENTIIIKLYSILLTFSIIVLAYNKEKINSIYYWLLIIFSILFEILCIKSSISPNIDTFEFLNKAVESILLNNNPYNLVFSDFYNGTYSSNYGNTYVFNYWPISLYIMAPFKLLKLDIRYSFIVLNVCVCILIYLIFRKQNLKHALILSSTYLSSPFVIYTAERCWIDAYTPVFLLLSILLINIKRPILSAFVVGLLCSIKLYFLLTLPIILLYYLDRFKNKLWYGITVLVTFCITFVPFFYTLKSIFNNTVLFFINSKPRLDSLSLVGFFYKLDIQISSISLVIFMTTFMSLLFFKNRINIKFYHFLFIVYFLYYMFSKQAFFNYFFYIYFILFISNTIILKNELHKEA